MPSFGEQDKQTVVPGGASAGRPNISGVRVHQLGNVITRSGWMTEIFRSDWPLVGISVAQVNWVELNPGAVTDWHRHVEQTDHLIGVGGNIKVALWDGRDDWPTKGLTDIFRIGAMRPIMVVVPPGVWHGLRNESGAPAGYINVTDQMYVHQHPDNWRLTPGARDIPDIL
jgi:dTDP-4-dehydrorhamnose 3,5-epimerase